MISTELMLALLPALFHLCRAEAAEFVEVKHGDNVTLSSPTSSLWGNYSVLWALNHTRTLINLDHGKMKQEPPLGYINRLRVNQTTGSLHLSNLSLVDSGIYNGQIINGDSSVHTVLYNVSVYKPAPVINSDPAPAPASVARHHWITGVCVIIFICVCIGLIFKLKKKNHEKNRPLL